jgi:uncharacterized tellurite resistance protein B-like protein
MFDKSFLKQLAKDALHVSKEVVKGADHVSKEISKGASYTSEFVTSSTIKAGEKIGEVASQAVGAVTDNLWGNESTGWDLTKLPEDQRLAFYGALFAIASADGHFDKDEMDLICGVMDLDGMSDYAKEQIQEYIIEPPSLFHCLKVLSSADDSLRYGVMMNMVGTAWADDDLDPEESKALDLAQVELNISDEQRQAINNFVQKMREIRARGLDDNQAADTIKKATAALSAVGVPITAVYLSGSVIGLSAAGITSGLAALGLGFGMVPGIGVAILVGTGIFIGASQVLDIGGKQEKERLMAERERKAQLVIANLQGALNKLIERVANLQTVAADAEANKEVIRVLTEKMRYLQQLVAKRKQASAKPV